MIALGVIGLIAIGCSAQSPLLIPGGMMGGNGMMGGGMMDQMHGGIDDAPTVNATPVPPNQPVDREVKLIARNSRFEPALINVKRGETIRFTIENQDQFAHNFVSQQANIAYTLLPAKATERVVWAAPKAAGTFTVHCTFHPGMQAQVVVE